MDSIPHRDPIMADSMVGALVEPCDQSPVQSITGEAYLIISRSEGWTPKGDGGGKKIGLVATCTDGQSSCSTLFQHGSFYFIMRMNFI
jgi:hypothetical protein